MKKIWAIIQPQKLVEEIKEWLKPLFPDTELIVIFGSLSRNDLTIYSDVDFLIVSEKKMRTIRQRFDEFVGKKLADNGFSYDVVVLSPKMFELQKETLLVKKALKEGIIVWKK